MKCNNGHEFNSPTRIKIRREWTTGIIFKQTHAVEEEFDGCPICNSTIIFDKFPEKKFPPIIDGQITCEYCGAHGSHYCHVVRQFR